METPTYTRSLNPKEIIQQIIDMEKLFDIEQIEDPQRMKMVCMKMKEHASLWWYTMQLERKSKGKYRIKTWDIIVVLQRKLPMAWGRPQQKV